MMALKIIFLMSVGALVLVMGITLMPDKWWYWLVRKLDR